MTRHHGDDRGQKIAALFAGELDDRTRRLEDGLLQLEHTSPDERGLLLDELVRAAHTLKGSAALMGVADVASISHELEDALLPLRSRASVDGATVTRLLADVDRLRRAGETAVGPDAEDAPAPVADRGAVRRPPTTRPSPTADAGTVRLPVGRLDALVGRTASLRVAAGSLVELTQQLGDGTRLRPLLRRLERAVEGVDVAVRDAATVPVGDACDGLARQVRDIAAAQDKDVDLRLDVQGAEIDRQAVGAVRDALVHLVRNAVDHGIEPMPERRATGKPVAGVVEVTATVAGDQVTIVVRDDGRGIDAGAVEAAASAAGLDAGAGAHEMIFAPGLSTARVTTEISGRGVGLDAVRERVEALGGTVVLASQPQEGTRATLTVPASVATAGVLLVEAQGHLVGVLLRGVRRLVRIHHDELVVADGRPWTRQGDEMLMVASLAQVLGLPRGEAGAPSPAPTTPAIVAEGAGQAVALQADRIVGEQEVLVRPLRTLRDRLPGVVAAGVLPQGQVVLALHPAALVRLAWEQPPTAVAARPAQQVPQRARILLAEDAPTTLALERGLLEAAGYEVVTAIDGLEAWDVLASQPVDVVVSDIDMPRLDGIALCERIRSTPNLWELPIVLVTSRETDEDRRRGADAGADAYLTKSAFAQGDLTSTIARVLA